MLTPLSYRPTARTQVSFVAAILALGASTNVIAQTAGGDPAGSSPITGALLWVQGTLLGNLATTAAVIAVAVVGLLMLTGRMDWKRGLTVILGAFILFGAASIVAGIKSAATLHS
jgi:type IV secretion system protein VirB2